MSKVNSKVNGALYFSQRRFQIGIFFEKKYKIRQICFISTVGKFLITTTTNNYFCGNLAAKQIHRNQNTERRTPREQQTVIC